MTDNPSAANTKSTSDIGGPDSAAAALRRRELARERQRVYRERKRTGRMVVPVEVNWDAIDTLVDAGQLSRSDENNVVAVQRALQKLINNFEAALFEYTET